MKRELQGRYVTIATVGERVQAFVPAPLPPTPPIDWTPDLRGKFDQALLAQPLATSGSLVGKLGLTPATVNKALGHLQQLGIVKELTARKRNRVFSYAGYLDIMNHGMELPDR